MLFLCRIPRRDKFVLERPSINDKTKYRKDIQVLRGLAVLAVVLFHAKESYFPLGYLGVDVFFVISGFVVTPLILGIFTKQDNGVTRLSNLKYFYKRRLYRLAPALVVTLAFSAIIVFLLGPITDHQRFARQGISTLLLVGNVGAYRYSGDYFSPNPNPLVHTWSLSVEEQIYIFLPIILMLILHNRGNVEKITKVVFALITIISFMSFTFPTIFQPIYSRIGILSASNFSFYSSFDRIWQFTFGGLSYLFFNRYDKNVKKFSKSSKQVFILAIIIILFSPIHIGLKASSIIASLITVVLLLTGSIDTLPDILKTKLEWLGDRSYSIYLAHMPLIYIARYSPVTQIGNIENRIFQTILAVVASVLLGSLGYSSIENRFRNRSISNVTGLELTRLQGLLALTIPLALLISMEIGHKHQYFGLDKNIPQPEYAGYSDPKCLRDSEMGPPCIYKFGSKNTVLLVGDSHAGHISQAVIDSAKYSGFNAVIWTHSGCPVQFKQSDSILSKKVTTDCIKINQQMKTWVLNNKPNLIIISQFVYLNSSQSNLRSAISALQLINPNILLIENTPIFRTTPYNRTLISMILQSSPSKIVPKSSMDNKHTKAFDDLSLWAKNNGIITMNFDSLFCNTDTCSMYSDAGWLYRDNDHFSLFGAALVIPQLTTFLKEFSTR